MSTSLASWNDSAAKQAIVDFVERTVSDAVPVEERVAVFDNDGTLWCEKPMPIQLDFILRRLVEMAEADPELRDRQPWKAAYERDYGWLGKVIAEHYAGDDTKVRTLLCRRPCCPRRDQRRRFRGAGRRVLAHRAASDSRSRLPRVCGQQKPIRIWSRTGRRPLLAAGNSNGDIPMLDFTQHRNKTTLRLLVHHDDADREFDYTSGAEQALEKAAASGWTIVSIKSDWLRVF
jgi:hypothetical protein